LVVAGVTTASSFTWLIVAIFLAGLVATIWGVVLLAHASPTSE
jgi:hypothetical protein